jgi:hypothetical protein
MNDRLAALSASSLSRAVRRQLLHSRSQQTNVERPQRVGCVVHSLTQQTFGQL